MNNIVKSVLIRKYTVAFMRIFSSEINENSADLRKAIGSLRPMKRMFLGYSFVLIQQKNSEQSIDRFLQSVGLPRYFFLLVRLLVVHRRFELFVDILEAIAKVVLDQHNQQDIVIYSAQTLAENDVKKIENYMYILRKKPVSQTTCIIHSDLIAGIRVESDNFILECSVRKQLAALSAMLKREGIVYE